LKTRVLMMSQEVHPVPPQKGAAVEQWMDAVAHRLTRYEPHLVSVPHPDRPDDEVEGGVHYHRIRIGRVYNRLFRKITRLDPCSYADRVARYAQAVQPAIIHIHNAPKFVDAVAARVPGAKVILHMHNEKDDAIRTRLDAVAGCSAYIRDWYQARPVSAGCFAVLDNGVDIAAYAPERSAPDAVKRLRAANKVPADRFVVLYAGRISPEKGPDRLAAAMHHLDRDRFHLVLIGEWPKGDPDKSGRVRYARELAAALDGLPHTVIDTVAPHDMPRLYALGDLLVIPSRFEEPFSMVAIEAMAAQVPVLALRKGGMTEYMRDGENALLLDGDASAEQIAAAIRAAADTPQRLTQVAAAARAMVARRFDWQSVTAGTERLYDEVLAVK
jgi:glycosyltransferase involved in cell wall biosynthesis